MDSRVATRLAWLALGLTAVLMVGSCAVWLSVEWQDGPPTVLGTLESLLRVGIALVPFPIVGALIVSRHPHNAVGWISLWIGVVWGVAGALAAYSLYGLRHPGVLPGVDVAAAIWSSAWAPGLGLIGTFLILLFPDGRLPSARWRPWAWFCGLALVLPTLVITFAPGPIDQPWFEHLENPLGVEFPRGVLGLLEGSIVLIPLSIVGCAVSLVQRFRRSRGIERLQLKWLATASATCAVLYVVAVALSINAGWATPDTPTWIATIQLAAQMSFVLIPIVVGIAILKYRLFDIDVVINKTLVFGALAAFISAVYLGIVVGLGLLIGSGNEPNLGLAIAATAIVAVAFQPAREHARRFANRLVYGDRASPYEVLSDFSDRVAETYATDEVLPRMARAIREGTGSERAEVWLRAGSSLRREAAWPEEAATELRSVPLQDGVLPAFIEADRAIAVRHQGELLGALTVKKNPGEPLTVAEDKLLKNLASQAGLVLRNAGLTSQLMERLKELQASRQRLVAAQDEERRRLERDIHDGAQQHLVALKTRLSLVERLLERDPSKIRAVVDQLATQADEALETLRDLARGIYPPLLADQGLASALRSHARKLDFTVEIEAEQLSRYPQANEAATYFCCLEALQNIAKYADASRAWIRLAERDGSLAFSVTDNGRGFDRATTPRGSGLQNMADRLAALGGELAVESEVGSGTTIRGSIPS